ncbi:MAG: helix-turn-helix transcriptional regulator [Alphaproteobacteria bacterium]|nr:helix-turn-helix transcriptional regulator [Alphaproteobacteria bacterium]
MKSVVENSGLSQTAVAEKLGISQPRLNQYLNGKREADYAFVAKFCRFFQVTPNYLFEFDADDVTEKALDYFSNIIKNIENWAENHDITLSFDDKAHLVRLIYKKIHDLPQAQQELKIDDIMDIYTSLHHN